MNKLEARKGAPIAFDMRLNKQSLSRVGIQGQSGLLGIEGCIPQDSRAITQGLQISGLLQGGKVGFIDGYAILPQPAEQIPAILTGAELFHQLGAPL